MDDPYLLPANRNHMSTSAMAQQCSMMSIGKQHVLDARQSYAMGNAHLHLKARLI